MKKKHLLLIEILEYLVILLLFVLLPILSAPETTINLDIAYNPFLVFFRLLLFLYLILRVYDNTHSDSFKIKEVMQFYNRVQLVIQTILLLFLLIGISVIFNFIAKSSGYDIVQIEVEPPSGASEWIWFVIATAIFAFFEEILFRRFLPEQARYFVKNLNGKLSTHDTERFNQLAIVSIEFIVIVLFALGHLYLGLVATYSAAFSAIILRLSILKWGVLLPACFAHALNNLIAFFILFYTQNPEL